ncbi:hypothetical protein NL676_023517 [Syzygium grande]|nr:hypothetical protein NL676_023517 [Syzygium grande]
MADGGRPTAMTAVLAVAFWSIGVGCGGLTATIGHSCSKRIHGNDWSVANVGMRTGYVGSGLEAAGIANYLLITRRETCKIRPKFGGTRLVGIGKAQISSFSSGSQVDSLVAVVVG